MPPAELPVSYGFLLFKMVAASVVVVLLAIVTLKYLLPLLMRRGRGAKSSIQVLDYQSLQPKKAIYIVQIEEKKIAVGVTEHSITKICEL